MDSYDTYRIMLYVHVAAALVGLGVTFSFPFLQGAAEKTGTGATRFALRVIDRVDLFVVYPAVALIVVFGVGLIFSDVTGYSDDFPVWLMVAIPYFLGLWLVSFLVQRPAYKAALRTLEAVPDDASLPEAYEPLGKRMQMVGGFLALSVLIILFLMVWKPGE